MFSLQSLEIPLIAAPMAGGVSTPELVGAVGTAGGLGFVAGGYVSAERLAHDIHLAQSARVTFGVNVFVPDGAPTEEDQARLEEYRERLVPVAEKLDAKVGAIRHHDDDWDAKVELLLRTPVPVVSFAFGLPPADVVAALQAEDTFVMVTVTSVDDARAAAEVGAEALIVQGPEAGGHRSTFSPDVVPGSEPLPKLLASVREAVDVPLIAAGGLTSGEALRHAFDAGAGAAQLGTAFLLADEAGTPEPWRQALTGGQFFDTRVTRAFTGRWARTLENAFAREFSDVAPALYPQVNGMTRPIRDAAIRKGDPEYMSLWAGTMWRDARPAPAGEIVRQLWAAVNR